MRRQLRLIATVLSVVSVHMGITVLAADPVKVDLDERDVPVAKRTDLKLYVTATGAFKMWKADPKRIPMIDVRTPGEFREKGYPKMAWRIPLTRTAAEFVAKVKKVADPKDTVLIICRSGNRSVVAVNMLAKAGYKKAYSVIDGFEGDRNSDHNSPDYGKRTVNGWKNAELPWTKTWPAKHESAPESLKLTSISSAKG